MKVFIGEGAFHTSVTKMFHRQGYDTSKYMPECSALVLIGGSDINPALYGEEPLKGTFFSEDDDKYDLSLYEMMKDRPKIGICRGGQLLNVLSGGSMWQHVDNHGRNHLGFDLKSQRIVALSSIHHQMMKPSDDGLVLTTAGVSSRKLSNRQIECSNEIAGGLEDYYEPDIEAVYYENTNSLCFQGHPEIGPHECEEYFFQLIRDNLDLRPT